MRKTLRLQPAIDFLSSYGLAIAVIGIALATVAAFALHSPQTTSCISPPGFSCSYISLNTSGALVVRISQALGSPIVINGVACSSQQSPSGDSPLYGNTGVNSLQAYYPPNAFTPGITMYSGTTAIVAAYCYSGGSSIAKGGIGTVFPGYLWINYTIPNYGSYIQKVATFSAPFVRGSVSTYTTTSSTTTLSTSTSSVSTSTSSTSTITSTSSTTTVNAPTIHYAPVTLTNSQTGTASYVPITITAGSAISGPFQQEIAVPSSTYSSYINSAWSNVEFTTGAGATGTVLQAWVQSGASNAASNTLVWVDFPSGLPSGASTIYIDFMGTNVMSSSGPTGEAPQLSSTYGQYDNGANVFTFYDNFKGTSLDSKWGTAVESSGGSIAVNNGATFATAASSDYVFLPAASTIPYPQITEMLFDPKSTASAGIATTIGETQGTTASSWVDLCPGAEFSWTTGSTSTYITTTSSCTSPEDFLTTTVSAIPSNHIIGFAWTSSDYYSYLNGTQLSYHSTTGTGLTIGNYKPYLGLSNLAAGSFYVPWVRARAYPPSGTMPSVSFGTLVPYSPMPSPFQQEIAVSSSTYSSYINSAWSNVEFTTGAGATGTVLQAWVQSGASNTASNTIVWVKLPYNFTGTNTIYIDFMGTNVMSSSGPTGEAPQLSSTYGQYDNGANVFTFYDNFKGTSLDSKWGTAVESSGGSIAVNNGATFSVAATTDYVFLPASATVAYPQITEMLYKTTTTNAIALSLGETKGVTASSWVDLCPGAEFNWIATMPSTYIVTTASCTSPSLFSGAFSIVSNSVVGFAWTSSNFYSYLNGSQLTSESVTGSGLTIANYKPYLGISNTAIGLFSASWVRSRAYPPSGTMPSASIGSVT